ncbi:thiopeptide-type bacteriocin biosynthesis protein [Streptomyces sp. NPDC001530]|uniref:thiopeptide-type bacteriocin biosynthesis protein n=1 Tax=Streptomyces sp. NPDC001530 TaxID=3364582 RepID=UPI003678CC1D
MNSKQPDSDPQRSISTPGVVASHGSNAAGRDVINSVAVHADTVLPAEAYAPIPDEAAADGLSNIPRIRLFVGRARELDALDAVFAAPGGVVLQALSGLGGVGKSFLAARWADTRATDRVRWWITAHSLAAVDSGLAALARALQPGLTQLPAELQTERALQWLTRQDDWLLVLDNVDHPDHIRPLLDRTANSGRVLVTTRRATGWHQLTSTIRLGSFDPDESVELFTHIFMQDGPRDPDSIAEVCEELGHLALAVEQAAAFCYESGTAPAAYLDMLRRSPADMYKHGPEGDDARTVARIWRLTLDRLADTPLAGQILRILAWYAPDNIPRSLLAGLADPPAIADGIKRLIAYSMISSNPDGSLCVHRLVQALSRAPQPDDLHREPEHVALALVQASLGLDQVFPVDPSAPASWPACRVLLPHIEALARYCPARYDTAVMVNLLDRAGRYHVLQGAAGRAIEYHRRALACCERELPESHLDLDEAGHRTLLRQHLDRTRLAVLVEAPEPEAYGWCGGRAHEVVVPLKATRPPTWPPLPVPSRARALSAAQMQTPAASSVLLAALYGDPRRQDMLLSRHLPGLLEQLSNPPWWFIRFRDPDQHLRVRIALPDPGAFADTARTVSAWADELRHVGLLSDLRYPTSYREMGRWGSGTAWEAAEEVFRADSRAVLAQLAQPQRPGQRTLVAAHTVAIASAFFGSTEAGMRWLIEHIPPTAPKPVPRPQFTEAVWLADPSDDWAVLRRVPGGDAIVSGWADRDTALATYRPHLPGPDTQGIAVDDVLTSLLHVHFVRHVAVNFPEEEVCLYLARAAALAWTARTRGRA